MDESAKKTALRMIPYGLYVLMAEGAGGELSAATINWLTQASFDPPLLALGVKAGSDVHARILSRRLFGVSVLGKGQADIAYAFFKPARPEGDTIAGQPFERTSSGAPVLSRAPAWLECALRETVDLGDHSVFVAEVTDAGVAQPPAGRPDDATLHLGELGEKVFYGG